MTSPAFTPGLGLPPDPMPTIPSHLRLDDPTTVYGLMLLLLSRQLDLRAPGPIRREGPASALRSAAHALGGAVLRTNPEAYGARASFVWLCDSAALRRLVWAARDDLGVARTILSAIPESLREIAVLGAWDARGMSWHAAPGLRYAAVGGPSSVLLALQEMLMHMGFPRGTLTARREAGSAASDPDELRLGGNSQVARLQRVIMEASARFPAAQRVRLREPMPRLRLHVQSPDRTRTLAYPAPTRDDPAMGRTVIREPADVDVRLVAAALAHLDRTHLLSPAERMWAAVMLLGLLGLEPGGSWCGAESAWRTQVEMIAWAKEVCGLSMIQPRFSSLMRQLEAAGLTERDDTRRRYRAAPGVAAAVARSGRARPTPRRLAERLRAAMRRRPRQLQWLELPAPVPVGTRAVMRLPRTGQSETLAFALAHLDLVWPTDGARVVWLDEGRSEVLKDRDALARLGLGARIAGDGPRPDLMVLTRDPGTGRELLVVAEACASQGAVTQTRERQLRRFLEGLREDVQVQLVTLVLREEHVDAWRHDLAPASWVWLGDRLAGGEPTLVPSAALREAGL